ncbi:TonB-dependent receptor [Sphingobacterium psychroaquaticum]|uniref:Outer membrane receptor proteins, mostly Fe transport n=1 Tax=Sphingobacterium psychroaquaticum TaxID=561061 RepID=A0A1X7HW03_9SPHI|nr:TonB-dependent receptor [Sphingobacterium psychroaquaticum]SMG05868.1 Outer membrane receptor proteins, mostly Fe transport [Sphingobacterium psychroaquaticum]
MKIFLTQCGYMRTLCMICCALIGGFFIPIFAQAQGGNTLEKRISIQFENIKLSAAILEMGERLDCSFVYSNQLLQTEKRVSKKYTNEKVADILMQLIGRRDLKFKASGSQIFIGLKSNKKKRISGVVTANGTPVPGAVVAIAETAVVTDADGRYQIKIDAEEQTYQVRVSSIGFKPFAKIVESKGEGDVILNMAMAIDEQSLEDVMVLGQTEVQKIKDSGFNLNTVSVDKFKNSTRDVNQILNTTTGIRIREYGGLGSDFNFSVNGLSGKAVRFFVDGIPMENYGVGMTFNNFPVNLAERLDVYKGVVPIELGADALGGAINMVTNKGTKSYLDASYSYGSFNTHRAALNTQYVNQQTGFLFKLTSFYNFSDNNYWMHSNPKYDALIQVPDGNGNFIEKSVRRFHDQYRSAMAQGEVGYVNKKWADVLVLGMLYNDHYKEYQTGARQSAVYGKVNRNGDYFMPSIRYKKTDLFTKGLSATAFMSYGVDRYAVVDTSSTTYWWDGSVRSSQNKHGEIGASTPQSLTNFQNTFFLSRVNLMYELNANNKVSLNQNHSVADQKSDEELSQMQFTPSGQTKSIWGASWQNNAFNDKLKTEVFAKLFHFGLNIGEVTSGKNQRAAQKRDYNKYGLGLAARYAVTADSRVRFSYERAYRLPELLEVLGDGVNVIPNPDIKPESSHNLNVGFDMTKWLDNHLYSLDVATFFRNSKDFIYSLPAGSTSSQFMNEGKVLVYGGELEARYKYTDLLEVTLNGSYQKTKQNQQYIYGTETPRETYGNMVPNQPWLFGNFFLSVGKNNWLGKGTRVQFDWSTQYFHSFFLTWEAWGSSQSLNVIPTQLLHNAGITYALKDGRYNIAVESKNLTNELAYDNFRLQKPGRSFNLKLRYYIH